MNKKLKIVCASLCLCSMTCIGAFAREVQTLNNFRLPAWQDTVQTGELKKVNSNTPWVLNISSLSKASSVDTYLANANGSQRSDYTSVGVGRHEIGSSAQAGYKYHAVLMNSNGSSDDGFLTGSWSPDK